METVIGYIWHSVALQLGLGGLVIAALLAIAWFIPIFRNLALSAAGVLVGLLAAYAKGAKDASDRAKQKQAEAERQAVDAGTTARADAGRDAAGGVRDGYDRDK
jgi:hypothetical protein